MITITYQATNIFVPRKYRTMPISLDSIEKPQQILFGKCAQAEIKIITRLKAYLSILMGMNDAEYELIVHHLIWLNSKR